MLITTTLNVEGYRITEYKGVVRGIIVRAPTIAQGIVGGLKNIIGGRIGAYTAMCEQCFTLFVPIPHDYTLDVADPGPFQLMGVCIDRGHADGCPARAAYRPVAVFQEGLGRQGGLLTERIGGR